MKLCESGKRRYKDELAAKIALANTQRSQSSKRDEKRVYRCRLCHGFHITSQPFIQR